MVRVLIVDDENWVRRGIIEKAKWHELGAVVAAEAGNGLEGLRIAREQQPDIVITDMKMPVMDGVELISHLRRELPDTSIIVISGYTDYEYTRQALLHKVADYILKPIKKAELNDVLSRTIREHSTKVKDKADADALRENAQNGALFFRNRMLNSLLEDDAANRQIDPADLKRVRIPINCRYLFASIIMVRNFQSVSTERYGGEASRLTAFIHGIMEKLLEDGECVSFPRDGTRHVFVLLCTENQERTELYMNNKQTGIVRKLEKELTKEGISILAGTGRWYQGLENTRRSFQEAFHALVSVNLLSGEMMMRAGEMSRVCGEFPFDGHLNTLMQFILSGDETNVRRYIEQMNEDIRRKGNITLRDLYKIRLNFINRLDQELKSFTAGSETILGEEIMNEVKDIWAYPGLDENLGRIGEISVNAAEVIRRNCDMSASEIVGRAIEYMRNHYAEKILLAFIAEKYHISEAHFCRIFKKESGKSFIDFLTEVRMEKARELFEHYPVKVCEVAGLVGYKDVRHFSKLYRKYSARRVTETSL